MTDAWHDLAKTMLDGDVRLMFLVKDNGEALIGMADNLQRLDAVRALREGARALTEAADGLEQDDVELVAQAKVAGSPPVGLAVKVDGTSGVGMFDLPEDAFPFTIEFTRADTGEVVHTIDVDGPGALQIPALGEKHGVAIESRIVPRKS